MGFVSPFRGASQPDIAAVTYGGVTYRCHLFLDELRSASNRVLAKIFTDGEDGQSVLLGSYVVRTAATNYSIDCPKLVGVSGGGPTELNGFVAHWIEYPAEGASLLWRASFDVESIAGGWTTIGSAAIHASHLYDVDVVEGAAAEIVVARRTALTTVLAERYVAGFDWTTNQVYSTTLSPTIDDTVLGIVASDTDSCVLVAYQDDGTATASLGPSLMVTYLSSAGVAGSTIEVGGDIIDGDNEFTNVGMCRVEANQYAVVSEFSNTAERVPGGFWTHSRAVAIRGVSTATTDVTILTDSHWRRHMHMVSRPWSWSSGNLLEYDVYLWCGFKSVEDGDEWGQTYGFALKWKWDELNASSTANEISPVVCSAIMDGSFDGAPSGVNPSAAVTNRSEGKRMNHVSHVSGPPHHALGPYGKSVAISSMAWNRIIAVEDGGGVDLEPAIARVRQLWFNHEDPWITRRDPKEVAQPDTPAWRGVPRVSHLPVETPPALIWSGGVTQAYDGQQLVELGFFWTPEIISAVVGNGTGLEAIGDYYYVATYVWPDANGHIHRSPPSRPVKITTVDITNEVTLRVRTMSVSLKDDATRFPLGAKIGVEIWRTYFVGGSIASETVAGNATYLFRRVFAGPSSGFTLQETPINDRDAFVNTIVDAQTNAILALNDPLPWQLNTQTLQWTPPPPIPHVSLRTAWYWKNRLWGYDRDVIRWSEPLTTLGTRFILYEFTDANVFTIDDIGAITGGAGQDNANMVFTEDGVYSIVGEPGAGGAGTSLDLQVISRGVGCIEPRSVVQVPDTDEAQGGVMFQSRKGLYMATRSQAATYVGRAVQDLIKAAGNIRSAVVLPDRHQVRFSLMDTPQTGPLVVRPIVAIYDYRLGLWCTATMPLLASATGANRLNEMQHATVWRGRYGEDLHVVASQAGIATERADDDTVYADEDTTGTIPYAVDIKTEWIKVVGMGNTARICEAGIQIERPNAGTTTVETWFDFDGTFDDSGAAAHTKSSTDTNIRYKPLHQKCRGILFRIYETGSPIPQTENIRLVSLTLHYKVKSKPQGRLNT